MEKMVGMSCYRHTVCPSSLVDGRRERHSPSPTHLAFSRCLQAPTTQVGKEA